VDNYPSKQQNPSFAQGLWITLGKTPGAQAQLPIAINTSVKLAKKCTSPSGPERKQLVALLSALAGTLIDERGPAHSVDHRAAAPNAQRSCNDQCAQSTEPVNH